MRWFLPIFYVVCVLEAPPFEKEGLGGILTSGFDSRRSNPPSPPFAKGGNLWRQIGQHSLTRR